MDKPSAAGGNIYAFPRGKARSPARDAQRNAMSDLADIIAAQSEIASAGLDLNRVVDAITLQVYDAGVCLAGEDRLVTLDSLPSVIREAIDTSRLVITRR